MRILFVTQVALDRPHGGPRHVLALARCWADAGHAVTLIAPGPREPHPNVRHVVTTRAEAGARLELELAARTATSVAWARPDVAYVRLSATSSAVPATLATLRVPFVAELNGLILDELGALGRPPAAIRAVELAQRRVAGLACSAVAVESMIGRHARERLGYRDVRVIPNGADVHVATPGDRRAARRRLGLPLEGRLLGFAGTLAPELRVDLLAEALRDRLPDVALVVAGDGPARSAFEALARDNPRVRWLGAVPHPTAIDVLRAADVCINVRDGNVGMKVLEYAAVGRRFVTFEIEGVERLTALYPAHRAVFLVRERSSAALAAAIRDALDEEAQGGLPAEAIERARDEVSWERTAARVADVLAEARDAAGGRRP